MKILQIANGDFFSTYGGGQVYVKNLVDEMINQALDVVVFSLVNKKSAVPFQKQNYRSIDLYEIYQKDENGIKALIRQINPDVIHIHTDKALFSRLAKELSIPNVVTAHHGGIVCPAGALLNDKDEICHLPACHANCLGCVLRNTSAGNFFYPLLKRLPLSFRMKTGKILAKLPFIYFVTPLLSSDWYIEQKGNAWRSIITNTDRVIAPSYAIAESMILNGLSKEKIVVVPHGIPFIPPCHGHSNLQPLDNNKLKFFYVGRIGHIKGTHILLKAFSQLNVVNCELYIIGDISEGKSLKLSKKYKKYSDIIFHGKVKPEEISKYICSFDVLIHPTICLEVFGLNIGEALLQKKPVIATRCGGAEMQIENRKNGLLIEPNNVDELKNAMYWMLNHREEVQRMSENANKNVISMEEHVNFLKEVLFFLSTR